MNTILIQYHKSKIGELILGSYDGKLCLLDYRYRRMRSVIDKRIHIGLNANYVINNNEILKITRQQIDEYIVGKRKEFSLPIHPVGTDFQKKVWQKLMAVKYGETCSYLAIAKAINNEKAVRAVAAANGANAISIIIPCHRVIGNNGKLVGYGGGVAVKKRLLNLERDNTDLGYSLF